MDDTKSLMETERQQWDALVTELDKELLIFGPVRHELGRILYNIKAHRMAQRETKAETD